MNVKSIIDITDAMMIAMCVPNIIVLYVLCRDVKKDLALYCRKYKVGKWVMGKNMLTELKALKNKGKNYAG